MRVAMPCLALLLCSCARACGLEGEYFLGGGGAGGGVALPPPIAHYPLDEESGLVAPDVVSGLDGTLKGGAAWKPGGGKIGGAIELDGLDDHVTLGVEDAFDFGPRDFSLTLWVRLPSVAMDNTADWVLIQHGNVNEAFYRVELKYQEANGRRVFFGMADATHTQQPETPGVCKFFFDDKNERWFLFAAVRTGSALTFYVNGLLWSEAGIGPIDTSTTHETSLGMSPGNLSPFPGRLDDVRFYDVALTEQQVALLYEEVEAPWQRPNCSD